MVELLPDGRYSKTQLFINKTRKLVAKPYGGVRLDNGAYIVPTKTSVDNGFGFICMDLK